ncbi:MAG TPA: rhomboid family intramembrane serine protease [Prolixibacteraceae bacterium]|nr:rhomboid family intramembrane serine protease [Prolixibacteraceae bacterium]HPS12330.1 rhomboid family intramembrane serine protease [Prolixibacteraceae bacterium]
MILSIVLITSLVSVYAFTNPLLAEQLSLKPMLVYHKFHVHRILTHSLVHADWVHLIVNMYVLYVFGEVCLNNLALYFGAKANLYFLELYLFSLIASSLLSVFKHRDNPYYTAIGASGAVMAVVFSTIFFYPWNKLWFFGVIPVPGILFGIIYLIYSVYMGKKNTDNIGHDAHFTGALFGFIFPILIEPQLVSQFIDKLLSR